MNESEYYVKPSTISSICAYVAHGVEPGGFVTAVLENDLREALGRADLDNRMAIFDIVRYCYNEIPGKCWGSPERVAAWLEMHRAKRAGELT